LNPEQERLLRQRLADATDDERRLNEKLVAIGGDIMVLAPPDMKPNPEFRQQWVLLLLEHGQLMDTPVTIKRKEMSKCHRNVATIWRKKQYGIGGICSGYGLSDDGLWREHTWGILRDGGILETTVVREKYFGLVQVGEMADLFASLVLGKEEKDEPAREQPTVAKRKRVKRRSKMSIAELLHSYMTFRAARERQEHELTVEYYQEHLDRGCGSFFGVTFDKDGLVADAQQPKLFAQWKTKKPL
jgi:hypothetical protein